MIDCFVVGCPHSGTTILYTVIGLHPQVFAVPDESFLFVGDPADEEVVSRILDWEREAATRGSLAILEKTPWHVLYLDRIFRLRPDAKVVAIYRNPIDVYASLKQRGRTQRIPDSMQARIDVIKSSVLATALRRDSRIIHICLEEFVSSPQRVLRSVVHHFGLDDSDATVSSLVDRQNAKATVNNGGTPVTRRDGEDHLRLRKWQVSQPIFKSTENRIGLSAAETDTIVTEMAPTVDRLRCLIPLPLWREFSG